MNLLHAISSNPPNKPTTSPCPQCGGIIWHSYTSIGIPLVCSGCSPPQKHRIKFRKTLYWDGAAYILMDYDQAMKLYEETRIYEATPLASAADLDPECKIFSEGTDEEFLAWERRIAKTPLEDRRRLRAEAIAARGGDPEPVFICDASPDADTTPVVASPATSPATSPVVAPRVSSPPSIPTLAAAVSLGEVLKKPIKPLIPEAIQSLVLEPKKPEEMPGKQAKDVNPSLLF